MLKFLQSWAKKVHKKESDVPSSHPHTPPPDTSKGRGVSHCQVLKNDMSQDDKDGISWYHNQKRILVASGGQPPQPRASNMLALRWDDDLASNAIYWAFTCPTGHSGTSGMGENIAWDYVKQGADANEVSEKFRKGAVEMWFKEVEKFNPDDIDPFSGPYAVLHYSQIMWADTSKIGCGYAVYANDEYPGYDKMVTVCNYDYYNPQNKGNLPGGSMYHEGYPCDECADLGKFCWQDALCA